MSLKTEVDASCDIDPQNALPLLNEELIACGWSREFSRSKRKHYYFNGRTGTACWSFEDLTERTHEVTADRQIRIAQQYGSSVAAGETPSTDSLTATDDSPPMGRMGVSCEDTQPLLLPDEPPQPGPSDGSYRRRRASSASSAGPHPKRPCLSPSDPLWNFTIESNCHYERSHASYALFGPHILLEKYRTLFYNKLRDSVKGAILNEFDIRLGDSAFTRWILEARGFDSGIEPLLPTCVTCEPDMTSLKNEILYQLPLRLVRPANFHEAMSLLGMFLANADRLLRRWEEQSDYGALLSSMWNKFHELSTGERHDLAKVVSVLHECVQTIKPIIDGKASSVLTRICLEALTESKKRVMWLIRDFLPKVSNEELAERMGHPEEFENPVPLTGEPFETVTDCPAQILCSELDYLPEFRKEVAKISVYESHIEVRHDEARHTLKRIYFDKLVDLYRHNTPSDSEFKFFPNRLWMLLERYNTFLNADLADVNQAALPSSVFECLNEEFGVTFEMFASPFNCYFKQYCSLFPDTDCYFGSRGPFSKYPMAAGSFQANPPFTEVLLNKVVDFVIERLKQSKAPLSVAFFVPDWRDPPIEALRKLELSPFNRNQLTFPAKHHSYRMDKAAFHTGRRSETELRPSSHGTTLIFMQNKPGYDKWTPRPHNLKKLRQAFMDE